MQKDELTITKADQAKALQNVSFLGQFVHPASPSNVAKNLGISANLVHHHAQKHLSLGLLFEVKRAEGKVYYQLAAKLFKCARNLSASSHNDYTDVRVSHLKDKFLSAFEQSERLSLSHDHDWDIFEFTSEERSQDTAIPTVMNEQHPAHYQSRTLQLTQASYIAFIQRMWQLLNDLESLNSSSEKDSCTLTFIGFHGALQGSTRNSSETSSFVPPPKL